MKRSDGWKPTFIGIGAQKSATSWCWEMLRQHPDVCAAQPKELNFFNDYFDRGLPWYARHFSQPNRPVQGEISPLYMDVPRVAGRIASCYPEAKILVILRDPYRRALSNLMHDIRGTDGQVAAATDEQARTMARQDDKFVRRSCYYEALAPYYRLFSRSQITVLYYEHLQSDERSFLGKLYASVGANAQFVPIGFQRPVNKTADYISPTLFKALRRASSAAKAWPPTRRSVEWLHRHTRLREWILSRMTVDRGRPKLTFPQVFGPDAAERISADVDRLRTELQLVLPVVWSQSATADAGSTIAA